MSRCALLNHVVTFLHQNFPTRLNFLWRFDIRFFFPCILLGKNALTMRARIVQYRNAGASPFLGAVKGFRFREKRSRVGGSALLRATVHHSSFVAGCL